MNAYWRAEMESNQRRQDALLALDRTGFYRRWLENGSPNSEDAPPSPEPAQGAPS